MKFFELWNFGYTTEAIFIDDCVVRSPYFLAISLGALHSAGFVAVSPFLDFLKIPLGLAKLGAQPFWDL